jgi:hypothetical protein
MAVFKEFGAYKQFWSGAAIQFFIFCMATLKLLAAPKLMLLFLIFERPETVTTTL